MSLQSPPEWEMDEWEQAEEPREPLQAQDCTAK